MDDKNDFNAPLKKDFLQFDIKTPSLPEQATSKPLKSEYYYLGINVLSVITNGINHFHVKYMKQSIGEGYDEYSFTIWRCLFILMVNYCFMRFKNETMTPFSQLKTNIWFWVRVIIQFVPLQPMLMLISFFRVSTATCFISMAPLAIVVMSCMLLGEKFFMRYIYGIFICFGGVLLIVMNEKKEGSTGEDTKVKDSPTLYTLVCGFLCGCAQLLAVAVHRVSSKVLVKQKIDMNTQLMYPSFACIVLSFIFIPLCGREFKCGFWLIFHSGLNCLIWLLSTILILVSFKGIELVKTTAIGYLNIVTVFILGVLFLGETIYLTDVLGSLLILGFNIYNTMYPPKDE